MLLPLLLDHAKGVTLKSPGGSQQLAPPRETVMVLTGAGIIGWLASLTGIESPSGTESPSESRIVRTSHCSLEHSRNESSSWSESSAGECQPTQACLVRKSLPNSKESSRHRTECHGVRVRVRVVISLSEFESNVKWNGSSIVESLNGAIRIIRMECQTECIVIRMSSE